MNNLRIAILVGYTLLSIIGLTMLSSITPDKVAHQSLMLFVGGILMFYIGRQDAQIFNQFGASFYVLTIVLLLSTFVLGDVVRGSIRWIDIGGFRLQPSELSKPMLIISFASFMTRFVPTNLKNFLINFGTFLLPTLLIFRQPDLGTALVIASIWVGMIFVAGLSAWLIATGTAFLALAASLSPRFLHEYQLARLRTFFDPYQDPLGSGYNVIQSIIAVGSGRIFGKGLGHGTQSHFRFLPERHTDFMFASLAEELGLVGSMAVIALFAIIMYFLLSELLKSTPMYQKLLLVGVFSYLIFQVAINIGMNLGIAPVTGVTLPLISYGGSSALATSIILGIALSAVNVRNKQDVLEIK